MSLPNFFLEEPWMDTREYFLDFDINNLSVQVFLLKQYPPPMDQKQ